MLITMDMIASKKVELGEKGKVIISESGDEEKKDEEI